MSPKPKLTAEPNPAGQTPGDLEIDLGAAMPAQAPKPKRGRPRTATPKPRNPNRKVRKDKGIKKGPKIKGGNQSHYIDNNILVDNNKIIEIDNIDYNDKEEIRSATKLKDKMTVKEESFLNSYLSGGVTIDQAMIQAGYGDYSQDWRYKLSQKIIRKYESQTQDHRIICRSLGAGEVAVITGLLDLAKDAKSEMVRLNAWSMLAKILGLTKEQLEGAGGLTIIFEGADQRQVHVTGQPPPPAGSPTPEQPDPALTYTRPLQITK